MSDMITVVGNIGSDVTGSTTARGDAITTFRLASTERWVDRQTGAWVDGATNWFSVVCFRHLARNAGCSLSKGQPVIVTGRLKVRPWERDGKSGLNVQIEADGIGHNLRLGTTHFSSGTGAAERPPADVDPSTGEILAHRHGPDEDDDGGSFSAGAVDRTDLDPNDVALNESDPNDIDHQSNPSDADPTDVDRDLYRVDVGGEDADRNHGRRPETQAVPF